LAVGCSDAAIKFINIEKEDITSTLKGHDDAVNSIYINHDNTAIYSTGNDGTIRVWK